MYAVGDYIVHPGQGVCQVKDVTESPNALYQLLPVGQRHPVHISFPVASEGRLRGHAAGVAHPGRKQPIGTQRLAALGRHAKNSHGMQIFRTAGGGAAGRGLIPC